MQSTDESSTSTPRRVVFATNKRGPLTPLRRFVPTPIKGLDNDDGKPQPSRLAPSRPNYDEDDVKPSGVVVKLEEDELVSCL